MRRVKSSACFLPPVTTGYLEGKSVVTKVLDDKLPIKVGDVISAYDGEPVEKRREFLARYHGCVNAAVVDERRVIFVCCLVQRTAW